MTQIEEYKKALQEKRQPMCVYCGKPLDVVEQVQTEVILWIWDAEEKKYLKDDNGGSADKPIHQGCETPDWDFVDSGTEAQNLGLGF